MWGGTLVLAERALLLGENPGGDVAVAGERVELDPVDGGGLERPRAMARRHAQSGRRSPIPRSSSSYSSSSTAPSRWRAPLLGFKGFGGRAERGQSAWRLSLCNGQVGGGGATRASAAVGSRFPTVGWSVDCSRGLGVASAVVVGCY